MPAGNIRNTEKLSYDKMHQYEIMVTALDCGQKRATEDVLVRVEVKPVCKPGWQGWYSAISLEKLSVSLVKKENIASSAILFNLCVLIYSPHFSKVDKNTAS